MSRDSIDRIREEADNLYRAAKRELYLNVTGLKPKTGMREIYRLHEEFVDPGLFLSSGTAENDEAGNDSARLMRPFIAESYLYGATADISDTILTSEAETSFTVGRKVMGIRDAGARLLSEEKKHKRDEIVSVRNDAFYKIIPDIRRRLGVMTEGTESLGFRNYIDLIEEVLKMDAAALEREAGLLLADTEYASREILAWFFRKKTDINPEDASVHDMEYLLNSAELNALFPRQDFTTLSNRVFSECGVYREENISLDSAKRKGKSADGLCFALNPPWEIAITIYPVGGVRDYDQYFGCLGHALSYAYAEPAEDFEIRSLREDSLVRVFSELFKSLIYEQKWLKKYLRIDADSDFMKFLNLRRLMSARLTAGRLRYESELYKNPESRDLPAVFKTIMESASQCKVDEREYLCSSTYKPLSFSLFEGILLEPPIRRFLKEKFDEEWWRIPSAGDYIKGLWREGGKLTTKELALKTGTGTPAAEALTRTFEQELG